jgi:pyroglutamyl-peptidase
LRQGISIRKTAFGQPPELPPMNHVLITGFEPFGGETLNPSALAVQALAGQSIAGRKVVGKVLPCVFGKSLALLRREIQRTQPELVICAGMAGGRSEISVERVALNIEDACIPDNVGQQPVDRPVIRGGPTAYWSNLPIKAIISALRAAHLPGTVSSSAGTFVCNHVFYGLMHTLARQPKVRGGFIHVPYLPEQARRVADGSPSLPLTEIVRGLEIAIETSLSSRRAQSGG